MHTDCLNSTLQCFPLVWHLKFGEKSYRNEKMNTKNANTMTNVRTCTPLTLLRSKEIYKKKDLSALEADWWEGQLTEKIDLFCWNLGTSQMNEEFWGNGATNKQIGWIFCPIRRWKLPVNTEECSGSGTGINGNSWKNFKSKNIFPNYRNFCQSCTILSEANGLQI